MSEEGVRSLEGTKHLIKCRCVLPQFKRMKDPPQHQFVVFSVIDNDEVLPKFVQCPNCGLVHKVFDLGRSEILHGKEHMSSVVTVDDVKHSLPEKLVGILDSYDVDTATYEHAQFLIENERWGEFITLASDSDSTVRQGKILKIMGNTLFKVETFVRNEAIDLR